jgi:hypothetical protein
MLRREKSHKLQKSTRAQTVLFASGALTTAAASVLIKIAVAGKS